MHVCGIGFGPVRMAAMEPVSGGSFGGLARSAGGAEEEKERCGEKSERRHAGNGSIPSMEFAVAISLSDTGWHACRG